MNTKHHHRLESWFAIRFMVICWSTACLFTCFIEAECLANLIPYRPQNGISGAAVSGNLERVASYLRANSKAITERDAGRTPLHWAAVFGRTNVVEYLLAVGADPNLREQIGEKEGHTPLHSAAFDGHVGVVELLLDHGADVKAGEKDGNSVLLAACGTPSNAEVIRLLIEAGADPNARSFSDATPLQQLSLREPPEVVGLLLAAGADVNQIGWEGSTALHWAMDGNNVAAALLLIEHGADGNARTKHGISALVRAQIKAAAATGETHSMSPSWKRVARLLSENAKLKEPASIEAPVAEKPTLKFNRRHKNT